MHALIDGDIIVYTAGFSAQKKDPETKEMMLLPLEFALANAKRLIVGILDRTDADDFSIFLTAGTNFRDQLATIKPYKGNRKDISKPVHYSALREYLITTWGAKLVENEEADDVLGITQYQSWLHSNDSTVICSVDKDLLMIPGWNYNIRTSVIKYIKPDDAMLNFYCQLITGDSTDNIPGLRGYGDKYPYKKARKYLEGAKTEAEMYKRVVAAYKKSISSQSEQELNDRILEVGRLLWIRREVNEFWAPPEIDIS